MSKRMGDLHGQQPFDEFTLILKMIVISFVMCVIFTVINNQYLISRFESIGVKPVEVVKGGVR